MGTVLQSGPKNLRLDRNFSVQSGLDRKLWSSPASLIPASSLTHGSSISYEVNTAKAKAALADRGAAKETRPKYGVDPRQMEKQVVELWTVEQGLSPCCHPVSRHQVKLHPYETVPSWSKWVKEQAKEIPGWQRSEERRVGKEGR